MTIISRDTQEGSEFTGNLKTVTEERVFAFSGGFPKGPDWPKKTIHTNLDFAMSCGLPTRAASGAMFEGYLTELMIDLFGESWLTGGEMRLNFINIVTPGDTLLPKAVVQSREIGDSGASFTMEVCCENQHGDKVVVGIAAGLVS
jgi:acyl dehydratase